MSAEQVYELLDRAALLPRNSLEQIELLREAVRAADAANLIEEGFDARVELTQAATFGGEALDILVHFGWLLARCDEDPARFPVDDILWRYKWVAMNLPHFPEVPRARMAEVLADLARRYEAAGSRGRPHWGAELDMRIALGDTAAAAEAFAKWVALPRDHLSDCAACERNREVCFAEFVGDDLRLLASAQRVFLGTGCMGVPHSTHAIVLLPLLRQRRIHEAETHHRQGWKILQPVARDLIGAVALHVSFAALTGNVDRAARFLGKHLPEALTLRQPRPRMELFAAGALLADCMLAIGRKTMPLAGDLSTLGLVPSVGRSYVLSDLRDRFLTEASVIAARFDARSGNHHVTQDLAARRRWIDLAVEHPISG